MEDEKEQPETRIFKKLILILLLTAIYVGAGSQQPVTKQQQISVDTYNLGTPLYPQTEQADPCGPWYLIIQGGHWISCRTCYTGGPTGIPYTQCIDNGPLPE